MDTPDILDNAPPALSATSDAPAIEAGVVPETPVAGTETTAEASSAATEAPESPETASEGTETEGEAEVEAQPESPAAPKQDSRTLRIKALEQQLAERDAKLDRVLSAVEQLATAKPAEAKPEPVVVAQPEPKPQRTAFDDPDVYEAAVIEWAKKDAIRESAVVAAEAERVAAEARAAAEKAASERTASEQAQATERQWQARRASFIEEHPDFAEVVENESLPISQPMGYAIIKSDKGPEMAYWLAHNPKEAARIAGIADATVVLFEMGRIAERLGVPEKRQVSRAPDPITPLGNRNSAAEPDADAMSGDEYYEANKNKYRPGAHVN